MFKPYSGYKDSEIDFPRKIPTHWKSIKLGKIGRFSASGIDKKSDPSEVPVRMVNYTDVYGNNSLAISSSEGLMETTADSDKAKEHSLRKGDVLFTPSSETEKDIGVSVVVTNDLQETVYSYHLIRFRAASNSGLSLGFRKYFCNSHEVLSQFSKLCKGTTRQILGRDDFCNIGITLPPEEEQVKIARFLDQKTAQIDALITKKEQMIELLKEERAAVINQAVTKGLDPNVEMKDSGIKWLGTIPKHWHLKKIKYVSRVNKESLSETTAHGYEFYYIDIGNVDLEEGFKLGEKIKFDGAPSRARRIVRKGDSIVSTVRTYLKAIAYIEDNCTDLIVSTGFAVVTPCDVFVPRFLYFVLRSERFIDRVCALSVGVSYPAINATELADIVVWYPDDKNEQSKIVDYLDKKTAQIDGQISREERSIELLKEYRTALISEAVTGKIDVRGKW